MSDDGLPLFTRIWRFAAVGVVATATHAGAGLGLHYGLGMAPFWANLIAFLCALAVSFTGQTRLAFPEAEANGAAFVRFSAVATFGLALNQLIVTATERLGGPYWLALAIIIVTLPAATFLALRYWALR